MEILAAIGSSSSTSLAADAMNADKRFQLLELQTTGGEGALAGVARARDRVEGRARAPRRQLAARGGRHLQGSTRRPRSVPRMQRDNSGNFFYWNDEWDPKRA
jgi:hypothetical protein